MEGSYHRTWIKGSATTFVGWPFELGHNLFYIVWAVLAMQFTFLEDPVGWFGMNMAQFLVVGWIGYYDLRILRRWEAGAKGAAQTLFRMAQTRQDRLIGLFPLAFGSSIVSFGLLLLFPDFFLARGAQWMLGCFQTLVAIGGLVHNACSLIAWQEPIVQRAMSELAEEDWTSDQFRWRTTRPNRWMVR